MHTHEGTLRAYLDGELNEQAGAAVAAHLRECTTCRLQLESLASRASAASQHLQSLAPHAVPPGTASELPAPAPVALSRLHMRLANQQGESVSQDRPSLRQSEGGFVEMFKQVFNSRYRAVVAGLAAMFVVALLLTLAPVQAAASQFLGLFRIRKFAVVSINPAAMQSLDKVGGQIDQLLSDSVTFAKQPGTPVAAASVAEATQKAGIAVRLPSAATSAPHLVVQDGVNATVKVDLARIRAILELAGRSDIKLPDALDGKTVEFSVPPSVLAEYDCGSGLQPDQGAPMPELIQPGNVMRPRLAPMPSPRAACVTLVQLASPTVKAPPGADISQVGEALLQLLGLTPPEAEHFAQTIDWSSTLVIPLPTDAASFRDVTVDGAQGVLIQSNPRSSGGPNTTHYTLFWEKSDMVYSLSGTGDASRGVELANSLH
jgi:hypothetical protein